MRSILRSGGGGGWGEEQCGIIDATFCRCAVQCAVARHPFYAIIRNGLHPRSRPARPRPAPATRARDPRARSGTANGGSDPRSRLARPRPTINAWRPAPATRSPWGWGGGCKEKGWASDEAYDAPPRSASARNPTRVPLASRACDLRPAWDLPHATRWRPAHARCPCDPPAARAHDSLPPRGPAWVAADSPVTYLPSQCLTSDLPVTYQ